MEFDLFAGWVGGFVGTIAMTRSLRIASPGFFGVNYGRGTSTGLLMGHAVYGLVVALIYGALV